MNRQVSIPFMDLLDLAGISPGMPLMLHGSFRAVRRVFPALSIEEMLRTIQSRITRSGSLIMPTFTYCFKRRDGSHERFDPFSSVSKVGAISEAFRHMEDVMRTHAPTHSFGLWGKVCSEAGWISAPASPLGAGSVLEWLALQPDAHILLLGVDFSSLSFGHYLEVKAPVPWADFSPWSYLGVEKSGVSASGEMALREVPGCARGFRRVEYYLLRQKKLQVLRVRSLRIVAVPVPVLLEAGLSYVRRYPRRLLCEPGICPPCDARRHLLNF